MKNTAASGWHFLRHLLSSFVWKKWRSPPPLALNISLFLMITINEIMFLIEMFGCFKYVEHNWKWLLFLKGYLEILSFLLLRVKEANLTFFVGFWESRGERVASRMFWKNSLRLPNCSGFAFLFCRVLFLYVCGSSSENDSDCHYHKEDFNSLGGVVGWGVETR